jgi:hypothetical protein
MPTDKDYEDLFQQFRVAKLACGVFAARSKTGRFEASHQAILDRFRDKDHAITRYEANDGSTPAFVMLCGRIICNKLTEHPETEDAFP